MAFASEQDASASGPLPVLEVPFIAQTQDLCGGAAAAMVLRYWGVADVQAADFQGLVDRDKRGIAVGDLKDALASRGFAIRDLGPEPHRLDEEITVHHPVIVLIDGGGGRLHFVVVLASEGDRVVFHDPAAGPFQSRTRAEFDRLRRAGGHAAFVPVPRVSSPGVPRAAVQESAPTGGPASDGDTCAALVSAALPRATGAKPEEAVEPLERASAACPGNAGPVAALAGVRFRQERFGEAAAFARRALALDPRDASTWKLLGTSLYLADEPREALRAWNRVGEPVVDLVVLEGLARTRQDIATAVLGLEPRTPLTEEKLDLAARRLEHLPTTLGSRVTYRPAPLARANILATASELPLLEPWPVLIGRSLANGIAKRESRLRFHSPLRRGEAVELFARYAEHRPSAFITLEIPRLEGVPGVVTVRALWDRQTYAARGAGPANRIETRRSGSLAWSHWVKAGARVEAGVSIERFGETAKYVSARSGLELRFARDRVAVLADTAAWGGASAFGFSEIGGSLVARSAVAPGRLTISGRVDVRRVGPAAPLAIWPGAGTGPGRPWLMRAEKLIDDGILTGRSFGRGLVHGTLEVELRAVNLPLAGVGLALFGDVAKAWDTLTGPGPEPTLGALGLGLRVRSRMGPAFRLDLSRRSRGGAQFSAGVLLPWPN